ncbi:hypothetical protein HMPREF1143_0285 [Peptoanaerobacter stomatis]|uniref:Uncharacterized protein n=1 Tax=Peptoanaerobacter stomatis TaxID=796937 RepID=J6H8C3_9FIRM|nr:hypothetical protein HMPREF1143_0285 [Peptoanaerobacter stomatis]
MKKVKKIPGIQCFQVKNYFLSDKVGILYSISNKTIKVYDKFMEKET